MSIPPGGVLPRTVPSASWTEMRPGRRRRCLRCTPRCRRACGPCRRRSTRRSGRGAGPSRGTPRRRLAHQQGQRYGEREDDERRHPDGQQQDPAAHRQPPASGAASLTPTPRTLWRNRGWAAVSPSLRRSQERWTSTVRSPPPHGRPQTSASSSRLVTTAPGVGRVRAGGRTPCGSGRPGCRRR